MAHELGHLKCDHGVWLTFANILTMGAYTVPGRPSNHMALNDQLYASDQLHLMVTCTLFRFWHGCWLHGRAAVQMAASCRADLRQSSSSCGARPKSTDTLNLLFQILCWFLLNVTHSRRVGMLFCPCLFLPSNWIVCMVLTEIYILYMVWPLARSRSHSNFIIRSSLVSWVLSPLA